MGKTLSWHAFATPILALSAIFLILFIFTRSLIVSTVGVLVLTPFFLPLTIIPIYSREMRGRYPSLRFAGVENCQICGERITRNKFTDHLVLMPYMFKTLRHYENKHQDLAEDARKSRWTETLWIDLNIFYFSGFAGWAEWNRTLSGNTVLEATEAFLVTFVTLQVVIWFLVHYLLVTKRGVILG